MHNQLLNSLRQAVERYNTFSDQFRLVTEQADELRRLSKRVTFHVSQQDEKSATSLLKQATKLLDKTAKGVSDVQVLYDNEAYKAASEEFMEACLTYMLLTGKNFQLGKITTTSTRQLGAFSDLCGELARHSVLLATKGEEKAIQRIHQFIQEVLLELTKAKVVENAYLRTKYDQAERALRKVEDILYQMKLRG